MRFSFSGVGVMLDLVHTGNSVGDFSPSGKCDRLNDMQKTYNCLFLKSDSILCVRVHSFASVKNTKSPRKIAGMNQALSSPYYLFISSVNQRL
jgi:hypothetical protein